MFSVNSKTRTLRNVISNKIECLKNNIFERTHLKQVKNEICFSCVSEEKQIVFVFFSKWTILLEFGVLYFVNQTGFDKRFPEAKNSLSSCFLF
jgi:hypothetical protein